jgi:uncharacterized protein YggT (Ycf19 family)
MFILFTIVCVVVWLVIAIALFRWVNHTPPHG